MKDHARRFRLRALMAEGIRRGALSVGDLPGMWTTCWKKTSPCRGRLFPEVWQVVRKEGGGGSHEQERLKFLRIQVLREVTVSSRQPIGLEPWGRMKVEYKGLEAALPWIQDHAHSLGMPADDLREGIASLLDYLRRKRVLHDPEREIFTKYWMEGDLEIQQGYLPQMGNPVGTKLTPGTRREIRIGGPMVQRAGRHHNPADSPQMGCPCREMEDFLQGSVSFPCRKKLLVPVQLKGSRRKPASPISADSIKSTLTCCGFTRTMAYGDVRAAGAARPDVRPNRHARHGGVTESLSSFGRIRTITTCRYSTRATPCFALKSIRPWSLTTSARGSRTSSKVSRKLSTRLCARHSELGVDIACSMLCSCGMSLHFPPITGNAQDVPAGATGWPLTSPTAGPSPTTVPISQTQSKYSQAG